MRCIFIEWKLFCLARACIRYALVVQSYQFQFLLRKHNYTYYRLGHAHFPPIASIKNVSNTGGFSVMQRKKLDGLMVGG